MDGDPLRLCVCSLPCDGVFFTAKALLARLAAGARVSLKVMTSAVPSTVAELTVGAVVSGTVTVIELVLSLASQFAV